jgi:hypothetical protein
LRRPQSTFPAQDFFLVFKVFLLVDEDTVEKYKADLSDEIEPQITELISRAEKGLKALQKKRHLLQTKVCRPLYHLGLAAKQDSGGNSSIEATIAVCARRDKPSLADARKAA